MSKNIERERVFLLKKIPKDIAKHKIIEIKIGNLNSTDDFDMLKIRKKNNEYELIKKRLISEEKTKEYVIKINKEEFNNIYPISIRKHRKKRVLYPLGKNMCEIDFYQDELEGYVRAEVEFNDSKNYQNFSPPEWFGDEITDINHEMHKGLGKISFQDMKKRYDKKNINLKKLFFPTK